MKYINFQWKKGIYPSVLHLMVSERSSSFSKAKKTVNSYCIYYTVGGGDGEIASNIKKKWTPAKNPQM